MTRIYSSAPDALPHLMERVLVGHTVGSRQGEQTRERLFEQIHLTNPWVREFTSPVRAASLPAQIAETMWVLAGRNDVEWLSHYLPRAAEFSDDGKVWHGGYGPRLRAWTNSAPWMEPVDQLADVVRQLQHDDGTRRAVISLYDPDLDNSVDYGGKDVPCNNWLHFIMRDEMLNLHVATRSNDLMWGWSGINAFEWSAVQEIVAGLLGADIGSLVFSISSLHLYEKHWDRAERIRDEQYRAREHYQVKTPRFNASTFGYNLEQFDDLVTQWFSYEESIRTGRPLFEPIASFPEPMLRSWLHVLDWWWNGAEEVDPEIRGTRLEASARVSPGRPIPEKKFQQALAKVVPGVELDFLTYVQNLHAEKHAVYGDSWKRRGEQIGIMANIARKVDRLGVAGGGDTSADTVIDLLVYLIKYTWWLAELGHNDLSGVDEVERVRRTLDRLSKKHLVETPAIDLLKQQYEHLEDLVNNGALPATKMEQVNKMLPDAFTTAAALWHHEKWLSGNATRHWNPEQ